MTKKNLSISTGYNNNRIDATNNWEQDDHDDIYSPPLSPPPPHLIYFPENYAGNKSWQQKNNYVPQRDPYGKKSNYPEEDMIRYAGFIRRQIFAVAKTLTKLIFQNNNLLLIANIINKLWRARANFIKPVLHTVSNIRFIMKNGGYRNLLKYTIHFIQNHFSKQQYQYHQSSVNNNSSPLTTMILVLATMSHLLVVLKKIGLKWASKTIGNMGGLDSIVLVVSAIAFARSIQSSRRVF